MKWASPQQLPRVQNEPNPPTAAFHNDHELAGPGLLLRCKTRAGEPDALC